MTQYFNQKLSTNPTLAAATVNRTTIKCLQNWQIEGVKWHNIRRGPQTHAGAGANTEKIHQSQLNTTGSFLRAKAKKLCSPLLELPMVSPLNQSYTCNFNNVDFSLVPRANVTNYQLFTGLNNPVSKNYKLQDNPQIYTIFMY